ncbi:hypothetical protein GE09DRAFT_1259196 [Coniochaeta sp. 2T2.1]|nr:hypothetical protein GE09DRAFT_1259196 [Coniochaeta sp. 2T2.1]
MPSHNDHDSHPPPMILTCGNSSAEARSRGCVFDLLTNSWMPAYCADPTTDEEYRAWVLEPTRDLGSFAFSHDEEAQVHISTEEYLSDLVGQHVYTTTENHLAYCIFPARRMHRIVMGEIKAMAHNTFAHTVHCTKALLKGVEDGGIEKGKGGIGSTFDVGIVDCVVDGMQQHRG